MRGHILVSLGVPPVLVTPECQILLQALLLQSAAPAVQSHPCLAPCAATATATATLIVASGGATALAATGIGTVTGRPAAARPPAVRALEGQLQLRLWLVSLPQHWLVQQQTLLAAALLGLAVWCQPTPCHQPVVLSVVPQPPPGEPASPRERPKLVLQPRSAPVEGSGGDGGAAKPRSNPFGDARPVDTVAKEREIEERQKQRRAEEEAAKRAAKEAAKAEAAAKEAGKAEAAAKAEAADKEKGEKEKADRERQRAAAKDAVAAAAADRELERAAGKAGPPPPPPPPAPVASAAEGAAAAGSQEGGSGRGRGAPGLTTKVITVPARSTGRGDGAGRGRGEGRGGGRGRGEHAAHGRGEARPGRGGGRGEHGGRGGRGEGRGGRGSAHPGRHHEERPAKVGGMGVWRCGGVLLTGVVLVLCLQVGCLCCAC